MTVETQVLDQSAPISATDLAMSSRREDLVPEGHNQIGKEIQNRSVVAEFREAFASARLARINAIQKKKDLHLEIQKLTQSKDDLVFAYGDMPQDEAFVKSVAEINEKIAELRLNFISIMKSAASYEDNENKILAQYADFAHAAGTPVPSPEELAADMAVVSDIPYTDDAQIIAEASPALETLSLQAADLITLQDAVSNDMMVKTQTLAPDNKRKLLMIGGGLALAYILFGGKSR